MTERVAKVKVQATADLKGLEDAKKALQDLQKAVGPTDAALAQVRQEILEFANVNKRTEAVIQAQVNAFQKLRQQAEVGGQVYNDLGRDIERLKRVAADSTTAISKLGQATANAGRQQGGKSFWQQQSESLVAFNRQAGQTGKAVTELATAFDIKFERAGQSIQEASRELSKLKQNASNIGSMFQGPQKGGGLFEIPRKGLADIQAFSQLVTRLKEQTETATGRVARLSEGLFAAGVAGKGISATVASLGGVAGAAENVAKFAANLSASFAQMGAGAPQWAGGMKAALNQISLLLNEPANGVANWVSSLNNAQAKLTTLNIPLEAFNNALAAIGPEGAAVAGVLAVSFAGLQDAITRAFRAGDKEASEALQSITDETQRLINKLAQLSEAFRGAASMNELQALRAGGAARFNETPAGTDASRRAANTIASAEARIKAEGLAQAEVLEAARQRYRGTAESVDALSERLTYLQSAMKLVDQSTTEGKAEFAAFSSEAAQVKQKIDALSQSYRTVADAIRDAAQAQGEYANKSTVANYLNRTAVRQQDELAAAAKAALSQPQVPLLPAGDISKPAIRGGARILSNFEVAGTSEQIGAAMSSQTEAMERALNAAEKEVEDLKRSFQELIQPVEKVAKSEFFSPSSINALKARREQIDRERNAVDMLGDEYKRLSGELAKVDRQLERTQSGGMRGKIGYIGQGIGAAASAGIFGGPEGAIGGLLGGAIGAFAGGPAGFAAGSFIGSSAGAYAGMGRQQLGQFTTYAADIQKAEIALKGITKTQVEYQRALAASASVTRDFNVPQLEATKGMTQLSAAVIGAGGKVADAEVVFRNVTAAIKASGGTSEDVQGALTALGQIFSKGKVSAEELQGQLGERLPGAVTMFAKATGRTLPQLQKDLEQGVVGLADLMKFVVSDQGLGQFDKRAKTIAKSSAEAGARLTVTFNDTKKAIGDALLPLGAQIQDSLANALRAATPALVGFATAAGTAAKVLVDNAGLIGGVLKMLLGFAAVAGAAVGVTQLAGAIGSVTLAVKSLGGVMGVTTLAARTLGLSIAAIPGIGWIAAGVTALGLLTVELYNNNDAFRTWVNNLGTVISTDFRNAWDNAVSIVSEATKDIGDLLNGLSGIASSVGSSISARVEGAFGGILKQVREFWNSLPEPIRRAMAEGGSKAVGGLLAPGNPALGYLYGAGVRAAQMGPGAPTSAGGKGDKPPVPGQLTDWQKLMQQQQEQRDKDLEKQIKAQAELQEKLYDAAQRREEQIAELRQRTLERAADMERSIGDQRLQIEREIADATARAEDLALSYAVETQRQKLRAAGLGTESLDLAEKINNRFRAFYQEKIQNERSATDSLVDIQRQLEEFRAETAKAVGQIEEGYAKSVRDILLDAGRKLGELMEQGARNAAGALQGGGGGGAGGATISSIADSNLNANARAWLSVIRAAEGTAGPNGYRTMFGGGLFSDMSRHPDRVIRSGGYASAAAGAYQFMPDTWRSVGGGAMTPIRQDRAAMALAMRRGVDLSTAPFTPQNVARLAPEWASLPTLGGNSYYGQPNKSFPFLSGLFSRVRGMAPSAPGLPGAVGGAGAALTGFDPSSILSRLQQKSGALGGLVGSRRDALNSESFSKLLDGLNQDLGEVLQKFDDVGSGFVKSREETEALTEALRTGMTPELAKQLAQIQQANVLVDTELRTMDEVIQKQIDSGQLTDKEKTLAQQHLDAIRERLAIQPQLTQQAVNEAVALEQARLAQEKLLEQQQLMKQLVTDIGGTLSQGIISSIDAAIGAAMTGAEDLSDKLKEIASGVLKEIGMALIRFGLNSLSGSLGLGSFLKFANGGVMTNNGPLPLKRYAAGGVAKSPQMAVYGERGPEAYVPLPDGRNIPVKMQQRSDALNRYKPISATGTASVAGDPAAAGASGAAAGGPIDVRYSVERINNVEYVTAEQFRNGMQQAAAQGAQRGEQRALRSLQQSTAVRSRVGMR